MCRIPLAKFLLLLLLTGQTVGTALACKEPEPASLPNSAITAEPGDTTRVPVGAGVLDANFLVQQLSAGTYAQREAVAATLVQSGDAARPALEAGTQSPDFEIRSRSERLLAALDQLAFRRAIETIRLEQELLESDRRALPFYDLYCQRFGQTPAALEVYTAYVTTDFRFLKELEQGLQQSDRIAVIAGIEQRIVRCENLLYVNRMRETADQLLFDDDISEQLQMIIAAIALTQAEVSVRGWLGLSNLLYLSKSAQKSIMASSPTGTLRRDILGQCCLTARDLAIFRMALRLTNYYGCKAGATLARSVFETLDLNQDDQIRGLAVEAIGLYGIDRPEDLALLIPLLDDQSVLLTGSVASLTCELGDAAVLAIVRLTRQNPNDYQFREQGRFPSQAVRLESQSKLRRWLVEQRGIEPARLFPPAPSTPVEFLTAALRSVDEEVITGSRFQRLTEFAALGAFEDDRLNVTLAGKGLQFSPDLYEQKGEGTGSIGMPVMTPWGRTYALIEFSQGVRTLSLLAVDTTEADKVIETRIQGSTPELFSLRLRETTGELMTEIRYQQRAEDVELAVLSKTNLTGNVLRDQTARATSLRELRRSEPELFERGLAPLLSRLKITILEQ